MQSPSVKIFYLNYCYTELTGIRASKAPTCGITTEQVDQVRDLTHSRVQNLTARGGGGGGGGGLWVLKHPPCGSHKCMGYFVVATIAWVLTVAHYACRKS